MIVCAGDIETFEFATPIGIGLIDSAINLTRLCLVERPKEMLFIGSCGSYGDYHINDIIESKVASNIEIGFLDKKSYTPIDNVISSDENSSVIINSSNYITSDSDSMKQFKSLKLAGENMEFYSVMRVAQIFNIPAGGVFCVTNYCDENAHRDFLAHHGFAKVLLAEYIKDKGLI